MINIPNILTALRIVLSFILLLFAPFTAAFFILYFLCGLTDALDGYIARKMCATTVFGAVFDSCADLIFTAVILIIILPVINLSVAFIIWLAIIFLIKLLSFVLGIVKYRSIAFLHTYLNKAMGAVLFFFPALFYIFFKHNNVLIIFMLAGALFAALEELIINITAKSLDCDVKSIFLRASQKEKKL